MDTREMLLEKLEQEAKRQWKWERLNRYEKACEVISRMPEESTFEDIQYHLYVLQCIERGERDIEDGRTLTHAEVENRLAKWLR
jgi:predicted transcriptional regulator